METVRKKPSKKHMALTFCIGLAFIVLVVWFVVEMILGIYNIFHAGDIYSEGVDIDTISAASALSDSLGSVEKDSKDYFDILLSNFVMQDMPPFEDINELDSEYIVSYGLWQTISLNNSQGILSTGETAQTYRVPKSLVEKMATYHLHYTGKIKHKSVELCGNFAYNKFNGTYTVPAVYPTDYLVPKTVEIVRDDGVGTVTLTVDCYAFSSMEEDPTANEDNFRKREIITLKTVENINESDSAVESGRYQIVSMKEAERSASVEDK